MNFTVDNLAVYCLQVALVIAAGALLPLSLRLKAPRPLLAYWHLLLAACVALPLLQPWKKPAVIVLRTIPAPHKFVAAPPDLPAASMPWSVPEILIAILAAGAAARLLWLCTGFLKLRIYRRSAQPLEPMPVEIRRLRSRIAPSADLLISQRLTSPVTFGFWNPAVILPAQFLEFSADLQQAIVCHELLHIKRRDWIVSIAEELIRCVLWFHPAIWWLLARIQLVREQTVDLAVIERTDQPERYVDALLVIAASKLRADLAPAPLFLKKRHLRHRVAAIVQGSPMPKRLLVCFLFAALPLIVGITAWQFPLNAAPQEVRDGIGVEVQSGPWSILHRAGISYPRDARDKRISGLVVVSVSIDKNGEVTDARVVSGPEELRKAVLEGVLGWHFSNADKAVPPSLEVAVRFDVAQLPPSPPPPPPPLSLSQNGPAGGIVKNINVASLPSDLKARVLAALPRPGTSISPIDLDAYALRLKEIDSHLRLITSMDANRNVQMVAMLPTTTTFPSPSLSVLNPLNPIPADGVVGGVQSGVAGGIQSGVAGGVAGSSPNPPGRIRIGGNIAKANLISKVTPAYPQLAKQARIQGSVTFDVIIGADGRIANLQLVSGHPLLVESAVAAVRQWVYKPTLLNGVPVEVITQIEVNYTLADAPEAN